MLNEVSPGQPIKAAEWNEHVQLLAQYQSERFNPRTGGVNPSARPFWQKMTIRNDSGGDIQTGDPLRVTGMRFGDGPMSACRAWMNSGFQLIGAVPRGGVSDFAAVATEAIPSGGIGSAFMPGLFAAFVRASDGSTPSETSLQLAFGDSLTLAGGDSLTLDILNGPGTVSGTGTLDTRQNTAPTASSVNAQTTETAYRSDFAELGSDGLIFSDEGKYKIIASSAMVNGVAFCYLLLAGGSSSDGGHLTGTTSSAITGPSQTTTVANKTVRCPLLASGKTIAAGTTAVISRNQSSGNWEIIEAQCAEE